MNYAMTPANVTSISFEKNMISIRELHYGKSYLDLKNNTEFEAHVAGTSMDQMMDKVLKLLCSKEKLHFLCYKWLICVQTREFSSSCFF